MTTPQDREPDHVPTAAAGPSAPRTRTVQEPAVRASDPQTSTSQAPAPHAPAPRAPLAPIGRLFAVVAFLEAFTWAGLLVGMFLKYVTGTTEAGVWLFGRLHGGTFMIYVGVTIVTAISLRWRWWVTLTSLLAAIPPLVTIPLEIWLRRTQRLARRPRVLAAESAEQGPDQASP